VKGEELREGMYLEALIEGEEMEDAYELNRSLLIDESKLFIVKDSIMQLVDIKPLHFTQKTVIVNGLNDGDEVITNIVPGAYDGMEVNIYNN
jgi:hypothetical protein